MDYEDFEDAIFDILHNQAKVIEMDLKIHSLVENILKEMESGKHK